MSNVVLCFGVHVNFQCTSSVIFIFFFDRSVRGHVDSHKKVLCLVRGSRSLCESH